jgi:hypothetical protein
MAHSPVLPPALNPSGQAIKNCLVHHGMMMRIIETALLYGKLGTHLPLPPTREAASADSLSNPTV